MTRMVKSVDIITKVITRDIIYILPPTNWATLPILICCGVLPIELIIMETGTK